ncbi:MAE_28990/MAE_18760 family HEPN-like nuclease [Microbacterium sp. NPDC096154]|uniref:MAE_28990/MAE_18760 family HEPN-like nuclease n=1 Tax=Microbacterium sp. NPDC096154 TaxID=3155549 RepID=UPI003324268B
MAKIRSVEALDDAISAEIAWRKQELSTARKLIHRSSGPALQANLRSGVVILYAHWEGWVKAVAQLYIRYVNTKAFPYDQLSTAFLGTALETKMSGIDEASNPLIHNSFAAFIQDHLSERASISESLVRTESNLSSSVFLAIIDRLGLERREKYKLRANMIDHDLVNRRNTIAHGEYLDLGVDDFTTLRANTLDLLELFTDDVRNAASTGRHLKLPTAQQ